MSKSKKTAATKKVPDGKSSGGKKVNQQGSAGKKYPGVHSQTHSS